MHRGICFGKLEGDYEMSGDRIEVMDESGVIYEADATQVSDGAPRMLPVRRYALMRQDKECKCGAQLVETPHGPLVRYELLEAVVNENDFLRQQHARFVAELTKLAEFLDENFGSGGLMSMSVIDAAIELLALSITDAKEA